MDIYAFLLTKLVQKGMKKANISHDFFFFLQKHLVISNGATITDVISKKATYFPKK